MLSAASYSGAVNWMEFGRLPGTGSCKRPSGLGRPRDNTCSPVVGGPKYTAAGSYYQQLGHDLDEIEALVEERYLDPITVPITAIYSRSDGIVSWRACVDERSPDVEHVEVAGSHLSLGFSPEVLRIIADRLRAPKLNEDV